MLKNQEQVIPDGLQNKLNNTIMIELKLTVEEINLVLAGLQELPARVSMQLILKLQSEGQKQFEKQQEKEVKK